MAWYKSQAALIVGSLLIALALVFISLFPLSQYCKPDAPKESHVSANNPTNTAKPSGKNPTVAQILESIYQTQNAKYKSEERAKQEKSWWHTFACEMKITDFFIATFTLWLVIIGAWQGWQLQRTVELGREEFIANQRPWVSVEVDLASDLAYDGEGWNAGTRWHIKLGYRLKNLGKTPATNVSFFAEIVPFVISHFPKSTIKDGIPQMLTPVPGTDVAKELESICTYCEGMTEHGMGSGHFLFPEEPEERAFTINAQTTIFEDVRKSQDGYLGQFLVLVCVTYGSTFSKDTYRTAKAFHLYNRFNKHPIDLSGENIPMDHLGLSPFVTQEGSLVR